VDGTIKAVYGIADAVRPESKQVTRRVTATDWDARNKAYARAFLITEVCEHALRCTG
jgi:hypothetical protein